MNTIEPAAQHAREVYRFFKYEHGIPSCEPVSTGQPIDITNPVHGGDAAIIAAEEARREQERLKEEADALEAELISLSLNLSGFDLRGMSDFDRLQLLRHIKKICEDYGLGTEKWDKAGAQDELDKLVPKPNSPISDENKSWWQKAFD